VEARGVIIGRCRRIVRGFLAVVRSVGIRVVVSHSLAAGFRPICCLRVDGRLKDNRHDPCEGIAPSQTTLFPSRAARPDVALTTFQFWSPAGIESSNSCPGLSF